jgi:tetratricopeptide (TPR) repeat protein
MINIAIYKKKDYKELLEIKSSHNITYFCNYIDKTSVKLKYKDNNALTEIKNYFKNQPFLLLFNDEKISTEIPDDLESTHICLGVNDFLVKTQRIFNTEKKGVNKFIIKSNETNLFPFDKIWSKLNKDSDFVKLATEFLFGKPIVEEHLFIYFNIIKHYLKNNQNLDIAQNYINYLIKKYPTFIEIAVLTGCYLYEQNNLYAALNYFEKALLLSKERHVYDAFPMAPKYHKTILEKMLQNTKDLIKKFDQAH